MKKYKSVKQEYFTCDDCDKETEKRELVSCNCGNCNNYICEECLVEEHYDSAVYSFCKNCRKKHNKTFTNLKKATDDFFKLIQGDEDDE